MPPYLRHPALPPLLTDVHSRSRGYENPSAEEGDSRVSVESLKAESGLSSTNQGAEQLYNLSADSNLLIEEFLDGAGI